MRAYERQPGESAKAFEAYKVYRDLGSGRSVDKAYEVYSGRQLGGKRAPGRFQQWSRDFDWVERARQRDDYIDMIRLQAVEENELTKAADQARRTEALREANLANEERAARTEKKFLERAERLIDELPLVQKTTVREEENGRPAVYVIQPATKNAVLDAARLHKIATRNEPSKVDVREWDLSAATDEQLERIAAGEDPARVLRGDP